MSWMIDPPSCVANSADFKGHMNAKSTTIVCFRLSRNKIHKPNLITVPPGRRPKFWSDKQVLHNCKKFDLGTQKSGPQELDPNDPQSRLFGLESNRSIFYNGRMLGDRLMVRRVALAHLIGVRIPVSQPFLFIGPLFSKSED